MPILPRCSAKKPAKKIKIPSKINTVFADSQHAEPAKKIVMRS